MDTDQEKAVTETEQVAKGGESMVSYSASYRTSSYVMVGHCGVPRADFLVQNNNNNNNTFHK